MSAFGNWLPFVGFRTFPVDNHGNPTNTASAHFEADFLCFEWFGFGAACLRGQMRRA
jgi:hypothetical protein